MKVIFAQGNPGRQYELTRHNIGFIVVDAIASHQDVTFSDKSKFKAEIAETTIHGEKTLLVKPTTFYNETGIAARAIIDFYKLDPAVDFVVIHDDLSLPFGTIKTRDKGRDAGNNGVKSLNNHIGESHKRIRIGIYNPLRERIHDADFVLGQFSQSEQQSLPIITKEAAIFIDDFLNDSFPITKTAVTLPEA